MRAALDGGIGHKVRRRALAMLQSTARHATPIAGAAEGLRHRRVHGPVSSDVTPVEAVVAACDMHMLDRLRDTVLRTERLVTGMCAEYRGARDRLDGCISHDDGMMVLIHMNRHITLTCKQIESQHLIDQVVYVFMYSLDYLIDY